MFFLDTNVISELRKACDGKAHANVVPWLCGTDATTFSLSLGTLLAIEPGVPRIGRRDPAQASRLGVWMDRRMLPGFAERILPVDPAVALRLARLHVHYARA